MKAQATPEEIQAVCDHIEQLGFRAHPLPGAQRTAIGITGNQGEVDRGNLESLSGVAEVIRVSKAYKLASRDVKEEDTVVRFRHRLHRRHHRRARSGHCRRALFDRDLATRPLPSPSPWPLPAHSSSAAERTSPVPRLTPFRALALRRFASCPKVAKNSACASSPKHSTSNLWNSSLNGQTSSRSARATCRTFRCSKVPARLRKPVLVKRGLSATLEEFLMAAEYVMSEGNYEVILCERGVRTFSDHARNTLDLSIIPAVQRASHLPILVDPSHATGRRDSVLPMARAAVASGADGILVEVHNHPETALSDGPQSIYPAQFVTMMHELEQIAPIVGRELPRPIPIQAAKAL